MFTPISEETYTDGQVIFNEQSPGDWVYIVLSGSVEISKSIGDQKFVIDTLKEGEVFGELSFLGGIKRTATVTAVGDTTVGIIDRNILDEEFNRLSSDFRAVLVAVVKRFKILTDRLSDASGRKEPRIQKTLSLSYKDRQSFLKAFSGDISNGGLFIKTAGPLPRGEKFLLKLQLPDIPEHLDINCTVAWEKKEAGGEDKRPQGMGVKFMEMSGKDREILGRYLKSISSK
ncbi:MAG: TIGR02266 family protein [Deltaproteobacteria bacterium]|nr:TIGR02266 family protein [Deltaproteobacteria bacterium]